MASRRNNSTRAEIDHSKHNGSVLDITSFSEPMHDPQTIAPTNAFSSVENGDRLQLAFSDFVDTHQQLGSCDRDLTTNDLIYENKYRRTIDIDSDSESDADTEPSPTPIISDLEDDVLCDTPNIQRVMAANERDDDIKEEATFPLHGISIPYIFDDEDSDTPEPLDTPQTPGFECNMNGVGLEQLQLSSDDDDSSDDLDYAFIVDQDAPLFPALSPMSRSWQHITMTKMNYKRCKRIKSITPITTEMAEWKINNIYTRRRSVANAITPTVHRLFKLDADLLEIRQQYLEKSKAKDEDEEVDEEIEEAEDTGHHNTRSTKPFRVKVNWIKIPK